MKKNKAIPQGYMTVGEVAKKMNVSVRTLQYYDKEVPYSVEVEVEEFKEDDKRINIMAVIYVERSSQKGIIIGSQGEALKKVGTQARLDIEAFFGKKVFLNLYVKVLKDWRNKDSELKNFGYANK